MRSYLSGFIKGLARLIAGMLIFPLIIIWGNIFCWVCVPIFVITRNTVIAKKLEIFLIRYVTYVVKGEL